MMATRSLVLSKRFIGFCVTALVLLMSGHEAGAHQTVEYWKEKHLEVWEGEHNFCSPLTLSGDSWELYRSTYCVDANHAMFIATGDFQFLDRALLYVNNMVGTARLSSSIENSQFGDGYLSWGNKTALGNQRIVGHEYPLTESYLWRNVSALLRTMKYWPQVQNKPEYRDNYNELLAFTEKHIWEKWYQRSAIDHIYRSRTHMASHWARIAMNLYLVSEDEDSRAQYLEVWKNIDHAGFPAHPVERASFEGASLRKQMKPLGPDGDAYTWSAFWKDANPEPQDVSHGNAIVGYIAEANSLGFYWTDEDMAKFVKTFDQYIFKSHDTFSYYVDGTTGSVAGIGWYVDGFMALGRYDQRLQERMEDDRFKTAKATPAFGNLALNLHILSGGRLYEDTDEDGIGDSHDSCLLARNVGQQDSDNDGFGNACDPDFNNNCKVDFGDFWEFSQVYNTEVGDSEFDLNSDGKVDQEDLSVFIWYVNELQLPGPSARREGCG